MNKIIAIVCLTTLLACGTKEKHEYPAAIVKNFMDNCNRTSNDDKKMCKCVLEKIQLEYTFEEFTAIELRAQAGQDTTDFLHYLEKAKTECYTELNQPKSDKNDKLTN